MSATTLRFRGIPLIGLMIVLGGCATGTPIVYWNPEAGAVNGKPLTVEPAINETGAMFDLDVAAVITERLLARLRETGVRLSAPGSNDDAIVAKISVVAYDPGSAAKRWVIAGWGSTICTVRAVLLDKKSGTTAGDIVIDKSVGAGGLYTVGADRWILNSVADELVDEITKQLGAKRP